MQESQKLMIDFPDYCSVVIKMLNNCIKEPHRYIFSACGQHIGIVWVGFARQSTVGIARVNIRSQKPMP